MTLATRKTIKKFNNFVSLLIPTFELGKLHIGLDEYISLCNRINKYYKEINFIFNYESRRLLDELIECEDYKDAFEHIKKLNIEFKETTF